MDQLKDGGGAPSQEFLAAVSEELQHRPHGSPEGAAAKADAADDELAKELQSAVASPEPKARRGKRKDPPAKIESPKQPKRASRSRPRTAKTAKAAAEVDADASVATEAAEPSLSVDDAEKSSADESSDGFSGSTRRSAGSAETYVAQRDALLDVAEGGYQHHCGRCKKQVEPLKAVMKSKGLNAKWWCPSCSNITSMLCRKMTWPPVAFASLPEEDQVDFWKTAAEKGCMSNGKFDYGQLRGILKQTIATRKTRQFSAHIDSEDLPMSVWIARGWSEDHIKRACKQKDDPVHGEVWCVPIRTTRQAAIIQKVEEEIAEAEMAIKKKKALPDTATEEEKAAFQAIKIQTESSSSSSSDKKKKKLKQKKDKNKPPAGETDKERQKREEKEMKDKKKEEDQARKKQHKEEDMQKKKEQSAVMAHNSKMQGLASVILPVIGAIITDAKQTMKDCAALKDKIPEYCINDAIAAADGMEDLVKQANSVLKELPKCAKNYTKVPAINDKDGNCFDKKALTGWVNAWKATIEKLKKMKALI